MKRQELESKLRTLEKKLNCINLKSDKAVQLIEKINIKIDKIKEEREHEHAYVTQGAMIRSRCQYYEKGEANTKYFFSLEKSKGKGKTMASIYNEENILVHSIREILNVQKTFYSKLYTANPEIKFKLKKPLQSTIGNLEKETLEQEITMDELALALKQTKRFKAPGLDGLTADFYKMFFGKIKHLLLEVFTQAFKVKRLHLSARRGIISLIPKSNKDTRQIKSWRPIILLCADYKLLAKIIANRIKTQLDVLIHKDQTGFIASRDISDCVRKVSDTISYVNRCKINALLIQIDFEKAFDRVEYKLLFKTLRSMNFGENMISWIRLLFTDFNLCTSNHGFLSDFFTPTRGLFQGNPISPYGFICIMEILANQLHKSGEIEGITIGKIESLLSMFADDLSLCIKNTRKTWEEVQKTFSWFENVSGLKVNYEKSTVCRIGTARKAQARFYVNKKLHWTDKPVNVLGW